MSRKWLITIGCALLFLVLSVWQKCTAWEDRFENGYVGAVSEDGYSMERTFQSSDGSAKTIVIKDQIVFVGWNGVRWSLLGHKAGAKLISRDWLYLPPYFRWWYGGE